MFNDFKKIHRVSSENGATLIGRREPCVWIRTDATLTVATISGPFDAGDVESLSPYARRVLRNCDELIIDLSGSDFPTDDGLRALLALWSPDRVAIERPRAREVQIRSERLTVIVRCGG